MGEKMVPHNRAARVTFCWYIFVNGPFSGVMARYKLSRLLEAWREAFLFVNGGVYSDNTRRPYKQHGIVKNSDNQGTLSSNGWRSYLQQQQLEQQRADFSHRVSCCLRFWSVFWLHGAHGVGRSSKGRPWPKVRCYE